MINDNYIDTLERLDAMRVREEAGICFNYFERGTSCGNIVNGACRKVMVTWVEQVRKALSFGPETVWIAMAYFDRYLCSGRGNSRGVLESECKFQLAAITSFYTAVKIHEPVVLGIDTMIQICRGKYTESDIVSMERDILSALDWKLPCHTPMDFARCILDLLPEYLPSCVSDTLLEDCQKNVHHATTDIYFSCLTPSVLGISCLVSSLADCDILPISEKEAIWSRLSDSCHIDLSTDEVIASKRRLLSRASLCKPSSTPKPTEPRRSNTSASSYGVDGRSTPSPICVKQIARQA